MALHELCTNAAKHGALGVADGQVAIDWALADSPDGPRLRLTWRETGGPVVALPAVRGFGSRLLERGLAAELRGAVTLRFPPAGLVCEIDAPAPVDEPEALFPLPD